MFTIEDPKLPGLGRYLRLQRAYGRHSTLRMLEYEQLEQVSFSGRVLDIGGGDKAQYRPLLRGAIDYASINIDPDIKPTWLLQPGEPFPVDDASFDSAVSFNTLEHVYDPFQILRETTRVLKPGGTLYVTVPFMFRMHAHPDDFFRGTTSWWTRALSETGFSSGRIVPLVWGRRNTAMSMVFRGGPLRPVNRFADHMVDALMARLRYRGDRYTGKSGQRVVNVALGWWIEARTPGLVAG